MDNPARRSALVAQLFDVRVIATELRANADASFLLPAETAACAGFAPQRIADFTAGRVCARYALAELGVPDFPLLINADRTPRWPVETIGSISHTSAFCCAVVADASAFAGIGVDVERLGRVTQDIEALVFTGREATSLSSLAAAERARAATVIFSAKEAFYKCQYTLTEQWLDFRDASLELTSGDLFSGTFTIELLRRDPVFEQCLSESLCGRFHCDGELVVTGMTLPIKTTTDVPNHTARNR